MRGKKLTRKQKVLLSKQGLDAGKYLFLQSRADGGIEVMHKSTGQQMTVCKQQKPRNRT
jgi:hypothetical protein